MPAKKKISGGEIFAIGGSILCSLAMFSHPTVGWLPPTLLGFAMSMTFVRAYLRRKAGESDELGAPVRVMSISKGEFYGGIIFAAMTIYSLGAASVGGREEIGVFGLLSFPAAGALAVVSGWADRKQEESLRDSRYLARLGVGED